MADLLAHNTMPTPHVLACEVPACPLPSVPQRFWPGRRCCKPRGLAPSPLKPSFHRGVPMNKTTRGTSAMKTTYGSLSAIRLRGLFAGCLQTMWSHLRLLWVRRPACLQRMWADEYLCLWGSLRMIVGRYKYGAVDK